MSLVQIIIDETTNRTMTGTWVFDRTDGGTLVPPQGTSFPSSPQDGEIFWRTDQNVLYRYNLATTSWVAVSAALPTSVKSGVIPPASFSGNPKKATVTFGSPYPDTNYSIVLGVCTDGTKTFALDYENKTTTGFVVNLNSNNLATLIEVGWHTLQNGS
jgi:hypothetical protein